MTRPLAGWVLAIGAAAACSRADEGPHRPTAAPVLTATALTGLVAPQASCTCASPESSPAPSRYEAECSEPFAVCADVHYAEYLARSPNAPELDRLGSLLATHYVESMVYDATISFRAEGKGFAPHDSTFRVRIGDVIPTPHGRARVVQVHRSFVEGWDDGRVTLHFLERMPSERPSYVYVSSGAPSHVDGVVLTMISTASRKATLVMVDGAASKTFSVERGDAVTTSKGKLDVVDVVSGVVGEALGWVVLDTTRR